MKPVLVSVIMGSDSDLPAMAGAVEVLEQFGIGHEVTIVPNLSLIHISEPTRPY